ncbi:MULTISPECIES: hypothetical protein [unclassified Actinopolyspora]|uniref:hypothetical protein n=1 Tax=unclassified Actinopolyspora TaxID=2639451 RepID=UPI0013F5F1E9|nr:MULTISPECIES: hypothetical protein [unclassified Actinopolyspora]NHD18470.1 hypothetical protein [Actinopolyspora sp. BKK2]NHE77571.1 hypothetical protein [Actinopolyspora sp. BKK1]
MSSLIEYHEIRPGKKVPDVNDALRVLPNNDLEWRLLEVEGPGDPFQGRSIDDIGESAFSSPSGIGLSWNEVKELSGGMVQAINILFVAFDLWKFPTLESALSSGQYDDCEFLVEVFDSTYLRLGVNQQRADCDKIVSSFLGLDL